MLKLIIWCLFLIGLLGCASRNTPAPIENGTNIPNYIKPVAIPVVSVAKNNQSNQEEVKLGSLSKPSESPIQQQVVEVNDNKNKQSIASANNLVVGSGNEWLVPTSGVVQPFSQAKKGINILGKAGQKVIASNSGKVVYSSNGLKGYGNLIIIKHSDGYLTAYAHNKVNLVQEGATVNRGDKIAEMGTDNGSAMLHFEIRKNGKPLDPMQFINGN